MEEADKNLETVACYYEEHDRLSNLSDDLILHILSFLSTKESYRTCVLSTRWRLLCTKILDLHFELPKILDPVSSKEIQFVHAVLLRRTENIRNLSLGSFEGCQSQDVNTWVSKALDLKVQELDLCLILHEKTLLSLRLSKCESLVVLQLCGRIQLRFNSSFDVYLPSLKILHLRGIVFYSISDDHIEYDLNKFLSGCPHVEELLLDDSLNKQPINISSPLLRILHLSLFIHRDASNVGPVQINAPSLKVLSVIDHYSLAPITYEVVNFSNIDEAALFIDDSFHNFYTFMKALSNVKSLTFGSETFHFLSMENKLDKVPLLTFHNLLSLSVEIPENCNWSMLVTFLHNAPKLKDLAIEKEIEKNSQRKEVVNSSWVGPSVTPTSLIAFEFKGIQNIKTELDFALYIINNSRKLEKVKIFTPDLEKVVERSLLKGSKKSSVRIWDINSI